MASSQNKRSSKRTMKTSGQTNLPDYNCSICNEADTENRMVYCDQCNGLYHYDCVGVDESIEDSRLSWFCQKCEKSKGQKSITPLLTSTTIGLDPNQTIIENEHISNTQSNFETRTPSESSLPTRYCSKCSQLVSIPNERTWTGICSDCTKLDGSAWGFQPLSGDRPKTKPSINLDTLRIPEFRPSFKKPTIRSEYMCQICKEVFETFDSTQQDCCPRCADLTSRRNSNQEIRSQSSLDSTRRKRELALQKLEDETKLAQEFLNKKYQILEEFDSEDERDEHHVDNQSQERTSNWLNNQNNDRKSQNQFEGTSSRSVHFGNPQINTNASLHSRIQRTDISNSNRNERRFPTFDSSGRNISFISTNSHTTHSRPIVSSTFSNQSGVHRTYQSGAHQTSMGAPDQSLTNLTRDQIASRQSIGKEAIKFSGAPEEWPRFINHFQESTRLCNLSDGENLLRLQKCLEGEAFDAVECRLYMPNSVNDILTTLRMLFGRPQMIIDRLLKKIEAMPPVKQENLTGLIKFSLAVQNLCATMISTGLFSHLNNPQLLQDLVNKLPAELKMDWSRHKRMNGLREDNVTIEAMSDWLCILAEDASEYHQPDISAQSLENSTKSSNKSLQAKRFVNNAHVETSQRSDTKSKTEKCKICNKNCRQPSQCKSFKEMNLKDRWNEVKNNKLCGKCLEEHNFQLCESKRKCGTNGCSATHHPILHNFKKDSNTGSNKNLTSEAKVNENQKKSSESTTPNKQGARNSTNFNGFHQTFQPGVYFKIVPVILYHEERSFETYAYLDDGSEITMMEDVLASELGLVGIPSSLCLSWTGNYTRHEKSSRVVSLHISAGQNGNKKYRLSSVRTVASLGLPTQTVNRNELVTKFPYLRNIPFPEMHNAKPRILIGLNHARLMVPLVTIGNMNEHVEEPIATKTNLGWMVYGQNRTKNSEKFVLQHKIEVCSCNQSEEYDDQLHQLIKQFFSLENFGVSATVKCPESKEITRAKSIMETSTIRKCGRFETGFLWKFDQIQLPNSYPMAKKRLDCLEKKLSSNPALLQNMNQQISEYIDKGYIRKLTTTEIHKKNTRTWYLPLFVALHPKKPDKIRMVWDAAAKVKGISLNSMLLSGPDLLSPLIDILRRFRERKIAICGDIREMFHQIMVKESDQQSQRFLWRNGSRNEEPDEYVMQVLTFGSTCSPSSAQYIKNLNAKEFVDKFPRAAFAITENHHVDDLLDSVDTIEEAVQLVKDVRYIHQQAGFEIRNFLSNSKDVLAAIGENTDQESKDLNICKDSEFEKILGMWWSMEANEQDFFTYSLKYTKINPKVSNGERPPTKREILRTLMSIYDPLGYLAYFLVYIKILLQDVWREKLDWDEPITNELNEKWITWFKLLPMVEEIRIPRQYSSKLSKNNKTSVELHTFVDSSINAYCAVSFFRIEDEDGVECVIIGAKTKVAPQKLISVPRLELLATVLGSRLTSSLKNSHTIKIDKTYMWTDSLDVLGWLNSDQRKYRQFVAFRVGEVLELTDVSWWNHVPGKLNVADDGTKWSKIPSFNQNSR